MKKIFTLFIAASGFLSANAQAILNEIYAFPGGNRNEFFEFYNNSNSITSMDNYTIVTYYDNGTSKGFFVMDLPNLNVAPRGYFVGSSAVPFNYQGVTNCTMSQFSWNDLAFMAAHSSYLRQWQMGTSVSAAVDGNANYDLVPLPNNFNDIFQKIGGNGPTYNVFVYRNGVLLSIFLGGTGGTTFLPTYILGLPSLYVDMTGSSPDFTINFSGYANARTEYVIQDIGSDNGYIRLKDGYCGTWTKSSSQVTHSPGVTNDSSNVVVDGVVSVAAVVVRGTALSGSTVTYDVVSAPITEFPITMNVYVDNGTIPGELDAGDTFIDAKTETVVSDGEFQTTFFPYTANILIQTVTSAGCIDNLRFIPNTSILPVKLLGFQGVATTGGTELNWRVSDNESGKQFEIQKSSDGLNFYTTGLIYGNSKAGTENYRYTDAEVNGKLYYRLKITDLNSTISYSNTILIQNTKNTAGSISLNQNPVDSYLSFSVLSSEKTIAEISIYNASGARLYSTRTSLMKGANSITLNLDSRIYTGIYILQVKNDLENNSVKFVKR